MTKIKKKWKVIAVVTGITGAAVGAVVLFKDKIKETYLAIKNR